MRDASFAAGLATLQNCIEIKKVSKSKLDLTDSVEGFINFFLKAIVDTFY